MNWLIPSLTLGLLLTAPATAQLGGLMRNAEPYLSFQTTYGDPSSSINNGFDYRLAWGNDFDATSLEVGLSNLRSSEGEESFAIDFTVLSESYFGDLEFDWGLALEIYDAQERSNLGLAAIFEVSLRDTPEPWDPYLLLRVREDDWGVGLGVRFRY